MGRGESSISQELPVKVKRSAISLFPAHRRAVEACLGSSGADWDALMKHPWIAELALTPQDPIHHQEGDVLNHTKMVFDALDLDERFRALSSDEQEDLKLAALLHDIAKPRTTVFNEDGSISAPSHSRQGSLMARQFLWACEWPSVRREKICGLVLNHMVPPHILTHKNLKRLIAISLTTGWRDLSILCRADIVGRIAPDKEEMLLKNELALEMARENDCESEPYPFSSDHARFKFFQLEDRDPSYVAYDDTNFEVTLMCALPGSGKDTWLSKNYAGPIVSLDELREKMKISPLDNQGPIVQAAFEEAKGYLRAGQSFAWNATSLNREYRNQLIGLVDAYRGRMKIVCIDTPPSTLFSQNSSRERVVPEEALDRMISRWEFPDLTECHSLEVWSAGTRIR
jgi:putative nucleotidyltransferase with HDIG domain